MMHRVVVGLLLSTSFSFTCGFLFPSNARVKSRLYTSPDVNGPILDKIPWQFQPLFRAATNATMPRSAVSLDMADDPDPFRYVWGTWIVAEALEVLMDRINEVRVANQYVYDTFPQNTATRLRVASGQDWDCILHVLPEDTFWIGSWPMGSWAVVKTLIGVTEIAALRGPDHDGRYEIQTTRDLRGDGDGTLARGAFSGGSDCIKYVGGSLRQYTGKAPKTILLEFVIRPPIGTEPEEMESLQGALEDTLAVATTEVEKRQAMIVTEEKNKQEETMAPRAIKKTEESEDTLAVIVREEEEKQEPAAPQAPKKNSLGAAMGLNFDKVGGLDQQLDAIARRVLASRANPMAARRLGVSHVRGILLSGPPGCGKTLLARELARILGVREPQIVNGPEILDKFIGEAEKKIMELFAPAEQEYREFGDESALHMIILDEIDAIARKRGSRTSGTTGVRDSVVNELLAKMDGIKEATNVVVVGLTNRPELLDPALLRPGRLEVQLRVELPDLSGRRDILRIHTRLMREAGAMSPAAVDLIEDISEYGMAARTEHFSGAEIAGLVRSAASFALARTIEMEQNVQEAGIVSVGDLEQALMEVRPAFGKQDELLRMRFPLGISPCSLPIKRIMRDLERFTTPLPSEVPRLQSLLLVGAGGKGGAGATALAAWAASQASASGAADYVRFVTALDLLSEGGGGDEARASALVERFTEAREMSHSLLVLDDVDQLCAGSGPGGYSSIVLATLRALLRLPPANASTAKAGGQSTTKRGGGKTIHILAATSRSDAACLTLHELFDETIGKSF